MTQQLLTLDEFSTDLPGWYDASTRNEYWDGWRELLYCLPAKADELGYFDMGDLCDIADWGVTSTASSSGCSPATRRIT